LEIKIKVFSIGSTLRYFCFLKSCGKKWSREDFKLSRLSEMCFDYCKLQNNFNAFISKRKLGDNQISEEKLTIVVNVNVRVGVGCMRWMYLIEWISSIRAYEIFRFVSVISQDVRKINCWLKINKLSDTQARNNKKSNVKFHTIMQKFVIPCKAKTKSTSSKFIATHKTVTFLSISFALVALYRLHSKSTPNVDWFLSPPLKYLIYQLKAWKNYNIKMRLFVKKFKHFWTVHHYLTICVGLNKLCLTKQFILSFCFHLSLKTLKYKV